LIIHCE